MAYDWQRYIMNEWFKNFKEKDKEKDKMKNDVVYKVKILLNYERQYHKTTEMGALTSPFAVHKNDVENIDD